MGAEAKLLDTMMKLYEYSKFVTEAKGAFAVHGFSGKTVVFRVPGTRLVNFCNHYREINSLLNYLHPTLAK